MAWKLKTVSLYNRLFKIIHPSSPLREDVSVFRKNWTKCYCDCLSFLSCLSCVSCLSCLSWWPWRPGWPWLSWRTCKLTLLTILTMLTMWTILARNPLTLLWKKDVAHPEDGKQSSCKQSYRQTLHQEIIWPDACALTRRSLWMMNHQSVRHLSWYRAAGAADKLLL